jgi:hypothetical protein
MVTRTFLIILALSLPLLAHPQQPKDRSIHSDEFTKARPVPKKKRVRPQRRIYRLASEPLAKPLDISSESTLKAGVTLWKVERVGDGQLTREVARRVEADTQFHEGDLLRLSIESPRSGYLYVIDRDWFADGSSGETKLIFPLHGEDNRLEVGKLIDIPAQPNPPFKAKPDPGQAGEMLTIIVTSAPLSLSLSNKELPISSAQFAGWEKRWSGMTERFEMINGSGEVRTTEEQQATGSRQLTRDDPPPQTIYFLTPRSTDGLLFNLLLAYVR